MLTQEEIRIRLGLDNSAVGPGMREARQHIEGGAEGVKLFNTHGHEMHRLLHLLDEKLPGTGSLLRLIFNPASFGIAAIVLGIQQLIEWMHRAKEKAQELIDKQIESVISLRKANDDARKAEADAADKFEKAMTKAQESLGETIKREYANRMQLLDAEIGQYRKLIDLQEARELASAKGDEAAQAAIKGRYIALHREFDTQSEIEKLELRRAELAERQQAGKFLKEKAESMRAAQTDLNEGFQTANGRTQISDAAETELRKKLQDALGLHPWATLGKSLYESGAEILAERDKEKAAAQTALQQYLNDKEVIQKHPDILKKLDEKLSDVEKQYSENEKLMDELNNTIRQSVKISKINAQNKIGNDTTLGLDLRAMEAADSPQLKQFLALREQLLSGRLNGQDQRLTDNFARKLFDSLPLTDKIKSMQGDTLPNKLSDAQRANFEKELQFFLKEARERGLKVIIPTDDTP